MYKYIHYCYLSILRYFLNCIFCSYISVYVLNKVWANVLKTFFGKKSVFKIHYKVIRAIWTLYIWFSSSLSFDQVKLKPWNNQRNRK